MLVSRACATDDHRVSILTPAAKDVMIKSDEGKPDERVFNASVVILSHVIWSGQLFISTKGTIRGRQVQVGLLATATEMSILVEIHIAVMATD